MIPTLSPRRHPPIRPSRSRPGRALAPHPAPRLAIALGALALLLTGCGLIPAQPVGNPLGLDGAPLNVQITGAGPSDLAAAAVGSATASGGFGDISTPVAPGRFELEQPLTATATVTPAAGAEPPTPSS